VTLEQKQQAKEEVTRQPNRRERRVQKAVKGTQAEEAVNVLLGLKSRLCKSQRQCKKLPNSGSGESSFAE